MQIRDRHAALIVAAATLTTAVFFALTQLEPETEPPAVEPAVLRPSLERDGTRQPVEQPVAVSRNPERAAVDQTEERCSTAEIATPVDLSGPALTASPDTAPDDEIEIPLWRERLLVSNNAELTAVAALIAETPSDQISTISRALELGGENPTLLWIGVQMCAREIEQTDCPLEEWTQRLQRADPLNSEAWMQLAANRFRRDDHEGALAAVQQAALAPESRTYFAEIVELILRAYDAAAIFDFREQVTTAFGIAASTQPEYGAYTQLCRTLSANDVAWADACLRYGQSAERQHRTELGQSVALSIQGIAFQALGQTTAHATVVARQEQAQVEREQRFDSGQWQALITSEPAALAIYLDYLRQHGEPVAQTMMQEQASPPRQNPPATACP